MTKSGGKMMKAKSYFKIPMTCLVMLLLVFSMGITAFAEEKGSIELQLPASAAGEELVLYTVATLQDDNNYAYTGDFAACGVTIGDLNDSAAAEKAATQLESYIESKGLKGNTKTVGTDGITRYTDLTPALYLVIQSGSGTVLTIQPSLVPIPHVTDGKTTYNTTIAMKYSELGGAVIATKVNEKGTVLADAHFKLQRKIYLGTGESVPAGAESGTDTAGTFYWKELNADLVSDKNGQIVLTDMPLSTYRLIETAAPSGYVLLEEPVVFTITKAGTAAQVNGLWKQATGTVTEVTIVNKEADLPQAPYEETETEIESETEETVSSSGSSSNSSGSGSSVKTGDNTPIVLNVIMLILSAGLAAVLILYRKRMEENS